MSHMSSSSAGSSAKLLNDFQLGDSLGKGAFGVVYRALNWATGETVAVKEIQLSNIPKGDIGQIMSEIDLLKNLNHPNIVKYKGFVKTREYLYIILEFCENGSLHNICKRFGKFPENLVAVYISQVLEGLVYLHDQGVIHRDIKGANILTTKDGAVKLADFGVAANTTAAGAASDDAVVGSPYWMAPEVIEQSGATTASDIWSVGCTVIELLEGRPPYYFLKPMPALYRIVQDDCPPIPDGASPIVKDFLYHCFQKDANLRIGAKKLLRHPWMAQVKKQLKSGGGFGGGNGAAGGGGGEGGAAGAGTGGGRGEDGRPLSNYNFDEAVLKVQEWNEALKSPSRPLKHPSRPRPDSFPDSPTEALFPTSTAPAGNGAGTASNTTPILTPLLNQSTASLTSSTIAGGPPRKLSIVMPLVANGKNAPAVAAGKAGGVPLVSAVGKAGAVPLVAGAALHPEEEQTDNWDDDFEEGISFSKLQALEKTAAEDDKSERDRDREKEKEKERERERERERSETDDYAQTIRPSRSPGAGGLSPSSRPRAITPIVEDYSELGGETDEQWAEKLSGFRTRNSVRRGLFHPDDIRTVGIGINTNPIPGGSTSPGPRTAPLPAVDQPLPFASTPAHPASAATLSAATMQSQQAQAQVLGLNRGNGSSSSNGKPKRASLGAHGRSPSFGGSGDSLGREGMRRLASDGFDKYAETEDEDYDDVFGKPMGAASERPMQLTTRLSNKSWLGDEDTDEEDPFAEIDEGFDEDDLEANLQRDKYARLTNTISSLIDELSPSAPDFQLREACDQLLGILVDAPEMHSHLVSSHGMLAILEVLEGRASREVLIRLLQIMNVLVTSDAGFLESFCLIGGIPVMMGFTSKKYPSECRLQASNFIQLLCHTSVLTLQMFISCRGLKVLVDLLDEDFAEQAELVVHALNGIGSVFELQSPTTKNDFCRLFIREGLLDPLSSALLNVMVTQGETAAAMKQKIIQIILVFCQVSQSDIHVRNALGTRKVVRRLLRACEILEPDYLVHMLKAVKHLSMNAMLLEVLQNANAIEILTRILDEQSSGPHSTEIANHVFQALYNLCRLNKGRQEEAAQAGIIASLIRIKTSTSPLKQLALPILCDLASAGKSCRTLLWQHQGLQHYIDLLTDPYFQVSALESILSWLQEETSRVEDELVKQDALDALLNCFVSAKAGSFENLLDPFLKVIRLSSPVAIGIAKAAFFKRVVEKLDSSKAVVKLNLLRILRAVCDVHPNRAALVERHGIYQIVVCLRRDDGAVLVRELAREIEPSLRPAIARSAGLATRETPKGALAPKRRARRTASDGSGVSSPSPAPSLADAPKERKSQLPSRNKLGDIPWQPPSNEGR